MKFLIWSSCFFVATILNVLLGYATGFKLGFVIFYLSVYFVAKKLCSMWDVHNLAKKAKKENFKSSEHHVNNVDIVVGISFCRRCGEKLVSDAKFCRKCGTEVINNN